MTTRKVGNRDRRRRIQGIQNAAFENGVRSVPAIVRYTNITGDISDGLVTVQFSSAITLLPSFDEPTYGSLTNNATDLTATAWSQTGANEIQITISTLMVVGFLRMIAGTLFEDVEFANGGAITTDAINGGVRA